MQQDINNEQIPFGMLKCQSKKEVIDIISQCKIMEFIQNLKEAQKKLEMLVKNVCEVISQVRQIQYNNASKKTDEEISTNLSSAYSFYNYAFQLLNFQQKKRLNIKRQFSKQKQQKQQRQQPNFDQSKCQVNRFKKQFSKCSNDSKQFLYQGSVISQIKKIPFEYEYDSSGKSLL